MLVNVRIVAPFQEKPVASEIIGLHRCQVLRQLRRAELICEVSIRLVAYVLVRGRSPRISHKIRHSRHGEKLVVCRFAVGKPQQVHYFMADDVGKGSGKGGRVQKHSGLEAFGTETPGSMR